MPVYLIARPRSHAWRHSYRPAGFNGGSRLPVDIHADDEGYIITAAVPGLKPEEVEVKILDNVVTLIGGTNDAEDEESRYLLRERGRGRLERTFELPESVDASKAEASMKDGLLTLRVPKAEETRPKVIKVKSL